MPVPSRRRTPRLVRAAVGALSAVALAATVLPAAADTQQQHVDEYGFQGEGPGRIDSLDRRDVRLEPTAAQVARAEALGATAIRWNRFGTPHMLLDHDGFLSEARDGEAVTVARDWLRTNRELFRLSDEQVDDLEVLRDSALHDSPDLPRVRDDLEPANPDVAHVVVFRQRVGDLHVAWDGLLTIGVARDGRIASVSSSLTGDTDLQGTAELDPVAAVLAAAADVDLDLGELSPVNVPGTWQTFASSVVDDVQRVRPVAFPTVAEGLRLAYEVTLLKGTHDDHGHPQAYISFVDAETGAVWLRDNRVDHLADGLSASPLMAAPQPFSGETGGPGQCSDRLGPFTVDEGDTRIDVAAQATTPIGVTDDDIMIDLYAQGGDEPVAHMDLLTSPEVLSYAPAGGLTAEAYEVEICPFNTDGEQIPFAGTFTASPQPQLTSPTPQWRVFPTNPPFTLDTEHYTQPALADRDIRELWCWALGTDCQLELANLASRLPWDVNPNGVASFTTDGNNASTAISHLSFLTPDTIFDRPFAADRVYDFQWNDTWNESQCDPSTFATDNDDFASTTNLFAMHNRMHDWSYFLGFTERNSNLQKSNFGNTVPERENDPELGSAQAGRLTVMGRDNANQITLQDGIPGITNQYLWQPLAGAFYGACADGAYDMAIVAHEYAHAISNRMTGGPDGSVGSTQGQSESWSDLAFAAYFTEYDLTAGEGANPFALAPYAAGDPEAGIRNYSMNNSPLNYSNIAYDGMGLTSPHADSEIWSAVNYDIMEALAAKYDEQFPSDDEVLQRRCADGELAADACPGNRRWTQLMFDGLLLQPIGASQIDSRDAMFAADTLRFDGANHDELWDAFARRGLGEDAESTGGDDKNPIPSWKSPVSENTTVRFELVDADTGEPVEGEIYVGLYEARITPAADTHPDEEPEEGEEPAREFSDTAEFVTGEYDLLARADGYGAVRTTEAFAADQPANGKKPKKNGDKARSDVVRIEMRRNVASSHSGATASGDGVNHEALIDDTEATNWASLEGDVAGKQVTVGLGERTLVTDVQVSAMLRGDVDDENDPGTQSRFSSLRSFDILACDETRVDCLSDDAWTTVYEGGVDFDARRPRPRVSDMLLAGFDVDDEEATHVRLVVNTTQCTGNPIYSTEENPVNDPAFSATGCADEDQDLGKTVLLSPPVEQVRTAELQVFGTPLDSGPGSSRSRKQ